MVSSSSRRAAARDAIWDPGLVGLAEEVSEEANRLRGHRNRQLLVCEPLQPAGEGLDGNGSQEAEHIERVLVHSRLGGLDLVK